MLLDGINHLAVLTADTERLVRFYDEMFDVRSLVEPRLPSPTSTLQPSTCTHSTSTGC